MSQPSTSYPPGPRGLHLIRLLSSHRKNPLWFLVALGREYGDIVHFRLGHRHAFFVKHPDAVQEVLETQGSHFIKGIGHQWAKRFLGEGLLTSEGELNYRQRRLIQPIFRRKYLNHFGREMVAQADALCRHWQDGETIDVASAMHKLTVIIVCKTLFGVEVETEAHEIGTALTSILHQFRNFYFSALPLAALIHKLPLPTNLKFRRSTARLDETVFRMIREQRANPDNRDNLLAMLLSAQEQQTDGTTHRMTDRQVRDEVMTLLLSGHDSTANALTWTWYLLSQHRHVLSRMHGELSSVLGHRLPTTDDVMKLPYVQAVFSESLRLFPPAFGLGRQAVSETEIGGVRIPKGSLVIVSPYVTHRDPRFFSDPDAFIPERWRTDIAPSRPEFAYFPFGGGTRHCVGEQFAWLEGILILATIAQRIKLHLMSGHPIEPEGLVTLRSKHGMIMRVEHRKTAVDPL